MDKCLYCDEYITVTSSVITTGVDKSLILAYKLDALLTEQSPLSHLSGHELCTRYNKLRDFSMVNDVGLDQMPFWTVFQPPPRENYHHRLSRICAFNLEEHSIALDDLCTAYRTLLLSVATPTSARQLLEAAVLLEAKLDRNPNQITRRRPFGF